MLWDRVGWDVGGCVGCRGMVRGWDEMGRGEVGSSGCSVVGQIAELMLLVAHSKLSFMAYVKVQDLGSQTSSTQLRVP